MRLSELAALTAARVEGPTEIEITGAAGLDEAGEGHITFLANPRYTPRVNTTRAAAIYLSEEAATDRDIAILRVKDPYLAYTRALRIFHPEPAVEPHIHPSAVIDPSARVATNVAIGACSVIGRNVEIAEGVCIHPNATIYDDVSIGKDSTIHSGVAIRERTVIGERVVIHNNDLDRGRRVHSSKRDDLRRCKHRQRFNHSFGRRDSRAHRDRRTRRDSQQRSHWLRRFWLRER